MGVSERAGQGREGRRSPWTGSPWRVSELEALGEG